MASKETGRGRSLARRLKAALDQRVDAQRKADAARDIQRAQARLCRARLLKDLADFGKALGHAKVSSAQDRVIVRYGGKTLRFESVGDLDQVQVLGDGLAEGYRLAHNAELGRWALHPPHGAPKLLFDTGLEDLIRRVFDLRPAAECDDRQQDAAGTDTTNGHKISGGSTGKTL
ncbi:MAG: hypothetical protein GXP62_00860 [Oligoflexia bacterium]|nr:hypothetical protein [Oligoflexia bacterium]